MDTTKNNPVKKPAEKEFVAGFEPMQQGFEGTPDQFAEYVANEREK